MNNWVVQDVTTGLYYELSIVNGIFSVVLTSNPFIRNPIIQDSVNPSVYWIVNTIQDGVIQWTTITSSGSGDTIYMYDSIGLQWYTLQIANGIQDEILSSAPPAPIPTTQPTGGGGKWPVSRTIAVYKRHYFNVDGKKKFKFSLIYRIHGRKRIRNAGSFNVSASKMFSTNRVLNVSAKKSIPLLHRLEVSAKSRSLFRSNLDISGKSRNESYTVANINGKSRNDFITTSNIIGSKLLNYNSSHLVTASKRMRANDVKEIKGTRDITPILVALELL